MVIKKIEQKKYTAERRVEITQLFEDSKLCGKLLDYENGPGISFRS